MGHLAAALEITFLQCFSQSGRGPQIEFFACVLGSVGVFPTDKFSAAVRVRFRVRFENRNVSIFNEVFLASPTEKERKDAFVRVQSENCFGCFQVQFVKTLETGI